MQCFASWPDLPQADLPECHLSFRLQKLRCYLMIAVVFRTRKPYMITEKQNTLEKVGRRRSLMALAVSVVALLPIVAADAQQPKKAGQWTAGDFHQHTLFTDGAHPMFDVIVAGFGYNLQWQANSEHGGLRLTDGYGRYWDDTKVYPNNLILGDVKTTTVNGTPHQYMWRWQSIRDYAYPMLQEMRGYYPDAPLITGMEWNMPGHEHCSTAIVAQDAAPIAQFEYLFDASDTDATGGLAQGWTGKVTANDHAKAVLGAQWMQTNYAQSAWVIPAHPERAASYKVNHFRDLNNAAPDVAFGFEGMPGHQKEANRGSYTKTADGGGTYGGAGIYIAKVGGLWDAMLGEGRHWWTFVNSDFHSEEVDFYPGEYARTFVSVPDDNGNGRIDSPEVVNGLRSGNSFSVHGDLINALDFTASYASNSATMGETLEVANGGRLPIRIRFRSPARNTHGDAVAVDHVDLIAGEVKGKVAPTLADGTPNPAYAVDTNPTTKVLATFYSSEWSVDADGWVTLDYIVNSVKKNMYFRLRGTNVAPNTPFETDVQGNPLVDYLATENLKLTPAQEAWSDLWFYSNPIFATVR